MRRAFVITVLTSLARGCGGDVAAEPSGARTGASEADAGLRTVAPSTDGGSVHGAPKGPQCPAWSALNDAEGDPNACSVRGLICVYPEGQAECAPVGKTEWLSLSLRSGCPEIPAPLATACTTFGLACAYITGPFGDAASLVVSDYCCDGTIAQWVLEPTGGCPTGRTCGVIRAADYDQTCSVDSDCVAVPEGDLCNPRLCTNCLNATVRQSAQAQYDADFAKKLPVSDAPGCPCPPGPPAVCTNGVCGLSAQPAPPRP